VNRKQQDGAAKGGIPFRRGRAVGVRARRTYTWLASFLVVAALFLPAATQPNTASPTVWFADHKIAKQVDTGTNTVTQSFTVDHDIEALAVVPETNALWVLSDKRLQRYGADTTLQRDIDIKTLAAKVDDPEALALNPYDQSLWLALEKTLIHLDADGAKQFDRTVNDKIKALSLDLDESVWVLTKKELVHFDTNGSVVDTVDLKALSVKADHLALDALGSMLWLAGEHTLYKFDITDCMENNTFTNCLIHETSPYLQQHAHNPVDWYPWRKEALEKARREDKPILLSVGYSACHWCHVMEQESFEDEAVAKVMNERFVCIKVDREERPDLDKIYQTAHQLLTQRPGGWPLNMFITPDDHMPFFGGTYFPKTSKFGMPGFTDVLQRVANFYHEHRKEIVEQGDSLRELFGRIQPGGPPPDAEISDNVLKEALAQLKNQFDPRHGGFGGAPKFPHPTSIEFCLRRWAHSVVTGKPDSEVRHIARFTLRAMASGGIYDQIGGGFCRYAVDEQWMIPHFEKMLYDNAQLLPLYPDAFLATGDNLFKRVAEETAVWTIREMQSPEGGYYSTLDADSEGHEGKFYVWTTEELKNLLNADEWNVLEARYGLKGKPNFEGKWHLHVHAGLADIADKLPYQGADIDALLASAHSKLFAAREKRIRPGRDEKILTSWNGLMIKGMARAGRLLERQDFIASAERALDFIRDHLWKKRAVACDVQGRTSAARRLHGCRRYASREGGGRAASGTAAESNAGSSCRGRKPGAAHRHNCAGSAIGRTQCARRGRARDGAHQRRQGASQRLS